MSSLRPQFVSLWSTRKGYNNPKYQYSVRNRECLPQARWVSPTIFILYKREWAHSFFYTTASTKQWICTKFTNGKYVAKLLKLTGKDGKFYMYIPIYKELQITERERKTFNYSYQSSPFRRLSEAYFAEMHCC